MGLVAEKISVQKARGPVLRPMKLEMLGTGIHSGRRFRVSLEKSPSKSGLVFKARVDGSLCKAPALWTRLSGTTRSTSLILRSNKAKVEVRTVEHLLAALYILGLQNFEIFVEEILDNSRPSDQKEGAYLEIPVLDGSSFQWMEWLWERAARELHTKTQLKVLKIVKPFTFKDGERSVSFSPAADAASTSLKLQVNVDFGLGLAQQSNFELDWSRPQKGREEFFKNFAPARTFGFSHEVKSLRERGLALGGSLDNAILIDGDKILNDGGFRVPNELSAHKLVDAVGDFSLAGSALIGHIHCVKAGHAVHLRALKEAVDEQIFEEATISVPADNPL